MTILQLAGDKSKGFMNNLKMEDCINKIHRIYIKMKTRLSFRDRAPPPLSAIGLTSMIIKKYPCKI